MNPTVTPRFDPDEATPSPSKAPSLSGLEKDNNRQSESSQSASAGLPRSDTLRSAATIVNEKAQYTGSGTPEDPYVVDWAPEDPQNPFNWSSAKRWRITAIVSNLIDVHLNSLLNYRRLARSYNSLHRILLQLILGRHPVYDG
jgi:hypothetical protein